MAAGLLLVAGCGGGDSDETANPTGTSSSGAAALLGPVTPATGTPVRIGMISDGKSAVSDMSIQVRVADATVTYLNEHHSGIAGRPIELVKCETLADPAKAADCSNQMVEEDVVAVVVGPSSVQETIWEPLHAAGVPVMFEAAAGTGLLQDTESTFNLADPIFPLIELPIQVAKENGIGKVTEVVIDVPAAVNVQKSLAPAMFEEAGLEYELVTIPPGTADMTPQMQRITDGGTGLVHVVGTEAFCISAFNGLRAVGYTGEISSLNQCLSDATLKSVPASVLEGMVVSATMPIGTDNPSTRLYKAIVETYGENVDTSVSAGMSLFVVLAAFQAATEGISGDITPASVIAAIKAMPEMDLPGEEGMKFRCNGKASPILPSVCVRGGLVATLDSEGRPTEYQTLGASPIED